MASPFDTLFGGSTTYTPSVGGLSADWMLDPTRWLEEVRRIQEAQAEATAPTPPVAPVRPSPPLYSAGSLAQPEPDSLMPPAAFTGVPPTVAPVPGLVPPSIETPAGKVGAPVAPAAPTPPPTLTPPPGVGFGGAFMPQTGLGQSQAPGGPVDVPSFMERLIRIESGGRPDAVTGSYRGLGQFGRDLERLYGITDWRDPEQQRRALGIHIPRLQAALRTELGREPTEGEIYLAHQQGIAGGPALLKAPGDSPAWEAIRRFYNSDRMALTAIFGNLPDGHPLKRGLVGRTLTPEAEAVARSVTAGDFSRLWTSRFDGAGPPPAPSFTATGYTPGADVAAMGGEGFVPGQVPPMGAGTSTGLPPGGLRPSSAPAPYSGVGGGGGGLQAPVAPPGRTTLASLLGMRQPPVAGNVWEAMLGAPSPTAFLGAERQGASAIMAAGQRLRLENPGASDDALMRMLMRDPAWGLHAINLGPQAATVLRNAISPPPQQEGAFTIGTTRYDASGRPIVTGTAPAPDQQRLVEWMMSLPPEQRAQAMAILQQRGQQSDKEQSEVRIAQARAADQPVSLSDLNLAGYLTTQQRQDASGRNMGPGLFSGYHNRFLTEDEMRRGFVLPVGGPPGQPPVSGPSTVAPGGPVSAPVGGPPPPPAGTGNIQGPMAGVPTNVPGITATSAMAPPTEAPDQARLTEFKRQMEQFGLTAPGTGLSPFNLFEAASQQLAQGRPPQAGGPQPRETVEVGPSQSALLAKPRSFRRPSGEEFNDVPELAIRSPILRNPETMFMGVGAAPGAERLVTRLLAQVPGLEATGEQAQTRGLMMDSLAAAFASLQQGTRLAGEHAAAMASIPSSVDFWSNPVRALGQAIELRRRLIQDLDLATTSDLPIANERAQRIRATLQALPTMESMLSLREKLISGETRASTLDVGTMATDVGKAVSTTRDIVTGGRQPEAGGGGSSIPEDLTSSRITTDTLSKLLDRPNISAPDVLRIQDELMRRIRERGKSKTGQ